MKTHNHDTVRNKTLNHILVLLAALGLALGGAAVVSGCEREANDGPVESQWKEAGEQLGTAADRTGEAIKTTGREAVEELGEAGDRLETWGQRVELRADQEWGEFRTSLDRELNDLDREWNEVEAEFARMDAATRAELQSEWSELEQRKQRFDERVAGLANAGEAEWREAQGDLYREWSEIRRDFDATRSRIQ